MLKQFVLETLRSSIKSLDRNRAGKFFYGTENKIRAGFGLVGSAEKKIWAGYEQLLRAVFSCFRGQNIFFLKTTYAQLFAELFRFLPYV